MVNLYTYLEIYLDDLHKRVSLSEFTRQFKKPHQTIRAHLGKLVKDKVLIEEKRLRFLYYKLNKANPLIVEYLSLCEKERTIRFMQKNALIGRLYAAIAPYLAMSKVLIFGSAVAAKEYADIDVLIIAKDKGAAEELKRFEETYSVKVHRVQTEERSLTTALLEEIRKRHIILSGHDYFIQLLYHHELGLVQGTGNETHRAKS